MRPQPKPPADPAATPDVDSGPVSDTASITVAIGRIVRLIGGLDAPGVRLRIGVALALTLAAKVIAVFAPLVLADGINRLAAGLEQRKFNVDDNVNVAMIAAIESAIARFQEAAHRIFG